MASAEWQKLLLYLREQVPFETALIQGNPRSSFGQLSSGERYSHAALAFRRLLRKTARSQMRLIWTDCLVPISDQAPSYRLNPKSRSPLQLRYRSEP